MSELPIYYYAMGASKKDSWRTSGQWPLVNQKLTRFYFREGKTGSIASINDGFLRPEPPGHKDAFDAYAVDYSTSSGKYSLWYAVNWPRNYPDMETNDKKGLTYTTPPLEWDMGVTGHPVVYLWFVTDAPDLDFFVYLEEVNGSKSTYITEGSLRASHRTLSNAPFNNLGIMGRVTEENMEHFANVLLALANHDYDSLARQYVNLGFVSEETVDIEKFQRGLRDDLEELLEPYYTMKVGQIDFGVYVDRVSRILSRHRLRLPQNLYLMDKALLTLEGLLKQLDPDFNYRRCAALRAGPDPQAASPGADAAEDAQEPVGHE